LAVDRLALVRSYYEAIPRELHAILYDEAVLERGRSILAPHLAADFHILLCGPEGSGFEERHEGWEGFVAGWKSWIEAYEDYRFETERIFEAEDFVIADVRQQATPRGGSNPIETETTGLWAFRGDQLERIEFHLDRRCGHAVAGLS
jgi:SnoaL-like protein